MFESSDCEHNATQESITNDSEDCSHSNLDCDQLLEKNTALFKENSILKSQFEQAIQTANQLQDVNLKNVELTSQIRELKNKNEDLLKRISLSAKTNNDLTNKLEKEKQAKNQLKQEYDTLIQNEVRKTKNIYKTQYDALLDQVKAIQEARENDAISQKVHAAKIGKVLDAAKHYFQTDVADLDSLITLFDNSSLNQPAIHQAENQKAPKLDKLADQYETDESISKERIKKYKSQLKSAMATIDELGSQIQSYKRSLVESEQKLNKAASESKDKLTKLQEEKENIQRENQRTVNSLQSKIQFLTEKVDRLSVKKEDSYRAPKAINQQPSYIAPQQPSMAQPSPIYSPAPINQNAVDDVPQTNNVQVMQQLNDQITTLTNQIKQESKKNDRLVKENQDLTNDRAHLATSLSQKDSELMALQAVHSESLKEIETLRAALKNLSTDRQKQLDLSLKKELKKQRSALVQLESSLDQTTKQLKDVEFERDNLSVNMKSLNTKIQTLENEILQLKDENNALQNELADEKEKLSRKKNVTEEDVMPISAWSCAEFSSTLASDVSKIARNNSLKPPSKLAAIYKIIIQYFEKQMEHRDNAIKEISDALDKVKDMASSMIVAASLAFTGEAPQSNSILCETTVAKLVQILNDYPRERSDIQRELQLLHSYVDMFNSTFGIEDTRDLTTMTENVKKVHEAINAKLKLGEKRLKKLRALEDKLETYEDDTKRERKQLEAEIQTNNDKIQDLELNLQKANDDIRRLTTEKQNLAKEKARANDEVANLQSELEKANETAKEVENNHNQQIKQIQQDVLNNSGGIIKQKDARIQDLETQLVQATKALSTQKSTLEEKLAEVDELKEELEKTKKDSVATIQLEKAALIDSYEKALRALKEQCDLHRKDVESLSERLSQAQETIKKSQISILQLKKENKQLSRDNTNIRDECDREKRLSDTVCQQKIASAESDLTKKFTEKLTIAEKERKRLITYILTELRPFSDCPSTIDEKTARATIMQSKDLLSKLVKSDSSIRRIVFASDSQTTEEAVAQAVLNSQ
ncbi:hypothetical protein TVAG_490200 [Trichomonas vaginalis G3]|uniref:Uncharacterized protein n=1 Tax=Trichomonas vaginalis (strain ATCC PRA-98 / G3) TaxID=412133 RepID=A2F0V7_TRIV3|nr:biological adhesion protein [Trichomonas vaginalis G3]EAY01432.1 hypothetical protein TVAG_490200 [Trichomonas vaginalis G3]KAI5519281.1 biological adhesion protein [Trichomonas vaginalis G3]|eukprot:XP_001314136.1 hypothetical protein [Trichomonas vaginalis G3]